MPFLRAFSLVVSFSAACTQTLPDDEKTNPFPDQPEQPEQPSATCATPSMGVITGTAVQRQNGSNSFTETSAQVTWTLVETEGCVDRYEPSGTATYVVNGYPCAQAVEPASAPIEPSDGELIVDRSTTPPTYRMHGASEYEAAVHCPGEPATTTGTVGGVWTDHEGAFDGHLIAGGLLDEETASMSMRWRFEREGAAYPPAGDCAEPAAERWQTVTESGHTEAKITWTRTATTGCVDTFTPSGTARALPRTTPYCTTSTYAPDTAAIGAGDGTLTIDRTPSPPSFRIDGATAWPATWHCTKPSGAVESEPSTAGGPWSGYAAEYDGSAFGGAFEDSWGRAAWQFRRI